MKSGQTCTTKNEEYHIMKTALSRTVTYWCGNLIRMYTDVPLHTSAKVILGDLGDTGPGFGVNQS